MIDHIDFLEKVKEVFPEKWEFKTALSIQDAMDSAGPNDVVVLNAGKHYVRSVGSMEEGGAMKGLYDGKSYIHTYYQIVKICNLAVICLVNEEICCINLLLYDRSSTFNNDLKTSQ